MGKMSNAAVDYAVNNLTMDNLNQGVDFVKNTATNYDQQMKAKAGENYKMDTAKEAGALIVEGTKGLLGLLYKGGKSLVNEIKKPK